MLSQEAEDEDACAITNSAPNTAVAPSAPSAAVATSSLYTAVAAVSDDDDDDLFSSMYIPYICCIFVQTLVLASSPYIELCLLSLLKHLQLTDCNCFEKLALLLIPGWPQVPTYCHHHHR